MKIENHTDKNGEGKNNDMGKYEHHLDFLQFQRTLFELE